MQDIESLRIICDQIVVDPTSATNTVTVDLFNVDFDDFISSLQVSLDDDQKKELIEKLKINP